VRSKEPAPRPFHEKAGDEEHQRLSPPELLASVRISSTVEPWLMGSECPDATSAVRCAHLLANRNSPEGSICLSAVTFPSSTTNSNTTSENSLTRNFLGFHGTSAWNG